MYQNVWGLIWYLSVQLGISKTTHFVVNKNGWIVYQQGHDPTNVHHMMCDLWVMELGGLFIDFINSMGDQSTGNSFVAHSWMTFKPPLVLLGVHFVFSISHINEWEREKVEFFLFFVFCFFNIFFFFLHIWVSQWLPVDLWGNKLSDLVCAYLAV